MKTKPVIVSNPHQNLTRGQDFLRLLAIAIAFVGVFAWFVKIVFF